MFRKGSFSVNIFRHRTYAICGGAGMDDIKCTIVVLHTQRELKKMNKKADPSAFLDEW